MVNHIHQEDLSGSIATNHFPDISKKINHLFLEQNQVISVLETTTKD